MEINFAQTSFAFTEIKTLAGKFSFIFFPARLSSVCLSENIFPVDDVSTFSHRT